MKDQQGAQLKITGALKSVYIPAKLDNRTHLIFTHVYDSPRAKIFFQKLKEQLSSSLSVSFTKRPINLLVQSKWVLILPHCGHQYTAVWRKWRVHKGPQKFEKFSRTLFIHNIKIMTQSIKQSFKHQTLFHPLVADF